MTVIRIKRSSGSSAPNDLAQGELAHAEGSDKVWIGKGTGATASVEPVAGKGFFLYLEAGASQTAAGTYTFSNTVNVPTQLSGDDSTKAASTAFVQDVVEGINLNDLSPTGDVSLYDTANSVNRKITNLADPVNDNDAANKKYVDGLSAGLDFKDSVRAVATSNVTSLSSTATIDGVSLVAEDRVLLVAQQTASENGIWVVKSAGWQRPDDYKTGTASGGAFVFVEEGNANANSSYVCTTNGDINVGTDSTSWSLYNTTQTTVLIASGGTGLTSLATGSLLYGPVSGTAMSALAIGSAGNVLVSDGTNPTWSSEINGGTF